MIPIHPTISLIRRRTIRRLLVTVSCLAVALVWTAARFAGGSGRRDGNLTILSYNAQNLFDDVGDGTEYTGFGPGSGWNTDAYHKRLVSLSRVIDDLSGVSPDVVALQEIEGPRVLVDLERNYLRFSYTAVVAPETRSPVRVGLLTRVPPTAVRVHQVMSVAPDTANPRMPVVLWVSRETLDVDLPVGRGRNSDTVRVLAVHWKSQSGGERQTEHRRIQSAALVSALLLSSQGTAIVVGDLNEDVQEFEQHNGAYRTALMPDGTVTSGAAESPREIRVTGSVRDSGRRSSHLVMYSPWLAAGREPGPPGSYYYAGGWERLDQVLVVSDSADFTASLSVVTGHLVHEDGTPRRYDTRSGRGYSDHLPVLARISLGPRPPSGRAVR